MTFQILPQLDVEELHFLVLIHFDETHAVVGGGKVCTHDHFSVIIPV
jgi:hypothetical protein